MHYNNINSIQFRRLTIMYILFVLIYFSLNVALAKTVKVAVIDTGFDFNSLTPPKLCKVGYIDLVGNRTIYADYSHGNNVVSIIANANKTTDYCMTIIKYYDKYVENIIDYEVLAVKIAIELKVDIINISGGGYGYEKQECDAIKLAIKHNITVVAAAGNDKLNIDKYPYYPARCSPKVRVIASLDMNDKRSEFSNYGKNVIYRYGENILGMTGTSQATASFTANLIKQYKLTNK